MFHELASLLPGSGSGFWIATESSFSQVKCRDFKIRNCQCKACEMRYCVFVNRWPWMHSKMWIGLWMEDDGSSGVVTGVAVSALPRRATAPRPRCRWVSDPRARSTLGDF